MRLYGLTAQQLGALIRLAHDNQGFYDIKDAPPLHVIESGAPCVNRARRRKAVADHLRMVKT